MKGIKNIAKRKDVREKISKALKGKKQPWNSGKNHWNWQGGISEGNRQLNRKKEKDWRFKILIRDNFTCWICEIKGEKLEVHHLMSYAKYPKLRFIISNGLTLCKFCHKTYEEKLMSTAKNNEYWRNRKINWKSHYFNPEHPHRQRFVDIIKQTPVKSVLEIGCGCGANLYNIKKAFPEIKVAGCDINADAIATAKELFSGVKTVEGVGKVYEENPVHVKQRETFGKDFVRGVDVRMDDIEFKVADAVELPFHGESFDMVITDAFLIYMGHDKIERVLREIRRVGNNRFVFSELHDDSWLGRMNLTIREKNRYYAYDYKKLLAKYYFKEINLFKIKGWGADLWDNYGYTITSLR